MSMQAIIMAGGAGTRLRPLTLDLPKPLAPLCGAPVMDYTLRLLKQHGFTNATATLWYRPEDVMSAFGRGRHGVSLSYQIETEPLGTAGSVKRAVGSSGSPVLVLSGDGLTNADLTAALAFHRARKAAATLILHRVAIPLSYGVVVTQSDGRIDRFIEKPDWGHAISSLVNTGIYILEPEALSLIPTDRPYDFGRELFPLMLEKGLPLYGYESNGYWCDIGDPAAFLRSQADLLQGKTGFTVLDPGIRSHDGVSISDDSYVANGVTLEPGAVISASCILKNASIGADVQLSGAIVCENANIENGAEIHADAVIGAGVRVGAFSRISSGVHLWPRVNIPAYAVISESIHHAAPPLAITKSHAALTSPGQAVQLCGAFIQSRHTRAVIVAHSGDTALYHLLLGALACYDVERVWALGRASFGLTAYAVTALKADGALLCDENGVTFFDQNGLTLNATAAAQLETAMLRQEQPAFSRKERVIRSHASLRSAYLKSLGTQFAANDGLSISLQCADRFMRALARDALSNAGHSIAARQYLTLTLTADDAILSGQERTPSQIEQWLLFARALQAQEKPAYDLLDLNEEALPCDQSAACIEQQLLWQDPLSRALTILSLLRREPFESLLNSLPKLSVQSSDIPCENACKGGILEALLPSASLRPQGGLLTQNPHAKAVICPDARLPLMRVTVSSRDSEHAQELCDEVTANIKKLLANMR